MIVFSRRDLARLFAPLLARLAPLPIRNAVAQPSNRAKLKMSLAQEFARSSVKAISPDGKKLCVEDWSEHGYPLRVLEIGSWRSIYNGHFQSRTLSVGFFGDSRALLVQALGSIGKEACGVGKGNCAQLETVIELRGGEHTERMLPINVNQGETYWPLGAGVVLDAHREGNHYRTETLALVEFPALREILKVQYAPKPREPKRRKGNFELSNDFGLGVSDNRGVVAYSFDHTLLCRRTEDLGVLWTRQIEPRLNAYKVVVSARGSHVAAAISDGGFTPFEQRVSYIAVYSGETGRDVARLPQSGTEGIALSPDGDLIAVVAREPGKKGEVVPTVHIYETLSGRELASIAHDRVQSVRRQFLESGCTVAFTSDGQHLVTSGLATKVWRMGE